MKPPEKKQRGRSCFTLIGALLLIMLTGLAPVSLAGEMTAIDLSPEEVTSLEISFFEDLSDGRLNEYDYYDAFLIASGLVDPREFSDYRERLEKIRRQVLTGLNRKADPYVLGKELLFALHDQVFTKYVETAGSANDLLDRGEYNCLSSSILYGLLARDLGLAVSGVLVPNHTCCVLSDAGGDIIIETTARYGFDPGRVEIEKLKNMVRYVYMPETAYPEKKAVTIRQMISLLYTNNLNLSGFIVHEDYADFLPKLKKASLLDPANELFRENIIVCLNNLALLALKGHDPERARFFIQQGKRLEQQPGTLEEIELLYYNQAAAARAEDQDYSGAVALIKEGLRTYPGNFVLTNNLVSFYGAWAEWNIEQDDYAEAVYIFLEARSSFPENKDIRENLRTAFYNHAAWLYNSEDYGEAVAVSREALDYFPGDNNLYDLLKDAEDMLGQ